MAAVSQTLFVISVAQFGHGNSHHHETFMRKSFHEPSYTRLAITYNHFHRVRCKSCDGVDVVV